MLLQALPQSVPSAVDTFTPDEADQLQLPGAVASIKGHAAKMQASWASCRPDTIGGADLQAYRWAHTVCGGGDRQAGRQLWNPGAVCVHLSILAALTRDPRRATHNTQQPPGVVGHVTANDSKSAAVYGLLPWTFNSVCSTHLCCLCACGFFVASAHCACRSAQVVMSRTFGNASPQGGVGVRMCVPLIDMLNHAGDEAMDGLLSTGSVVSQDNVRWDVVSPDNSASGGWEMVLSATKDIADGEPLLLSYREGPNEEFMLCYGLCRPATHMTPCSCLEG